MKKVFLVLAACAVVSAALVGCGSSSSTEGTGSAATSTAAVSSNAESGTQEETSSVINNASENADEMTLDLYVKKFQDSGETIKLEERKPYYEMVGAKDGIMFYLGNAPVKIYQYESVEALEAAKQQYTILADMTQNGVFILDTNNETAKEIFNSESK